MPQSRDIARDCPPNRRDTMTDPGVQLVREWLQRQPFSLRILTLILFMVEAVKDEFGEETMKTFEDDLRGAYRKLRGCFAAGLTCSAGILTR
jgi:hypothetical protein